MCAAAAPIRLVGRLGLVLNNIDESGRLGARLALRRAFVQLAQAFFLLLGFFGDIFLTFFILVVRFCQIVHLGE